MRVTRRQVRSRGYLPKHNIRRVIIKVEWSAKGSNVSFMVTNLSYKPRDLYEFCLQRDGTCEVRIDKLKNGLMADRLSCHRFMANQFRLFLHVGAYCLVQKLRHGLEKTEFCSMQIQQLRLRALKIGAQVKQSARGLIFHLASGYPLRDIFISMQQKLLADSSWLLLLFEKITHKNHNTSERYV